MSRSRGEVSHRYRGRDLVFHAGAGEGGYRVLACKYRPASFDGPDRPGTPWCAPSLRIRAEHSPTGSHHRRAQRRQETTTARDPGARAQPPIAGRLAPPPTICPAMGVHCQAIIESRHIDVLEMDAASHNSVEDVRQINVPSATRRLSARYKKSISSTQCTYSRARRSTRCSKTWKSRRRTPKCIFATTEICKVPVTVLSRCQLASICAVSMPRFATIAKHLEGYRGQREHRDSNRRRSR